MMNITYSQIVQRNYLNEAWEKERETERDTEREREREMIKHMGYNISNR